MIYFKPVKPWHIEFVAKHMREADVAEVKALSGATPVEALLKSVEKSDTCRTAFYRGIPVAIFGMRKGTVLSGIGVPWLLGTDDMLKLGKSLTKLGNVALNEMFGQCGMLMNCVHVKNEFSIKWLKRMGFQFDPAPKLSYTGEYFYIFRKEVSKCAIQ